MGCRIRTTTVGIGSAPLKDRMILRAWPKWCDAGIPESCLKREPQIPRQRNIHKRTRQTQWRVVGQPLRLPNQSLANRALAVQSPLGTTKVSSQSDYPI